MDYEAIRDYEVGEFESITEQEWYDQENTDATDVH